MRERTILAAAFAAAAIGLACSSTARAEEHSLAGELVFGRTVAADVMEMQRGKAVVTTMDVEGLVQDNAAVNTVSGMNVITNGAFTNASGLSTTIQNSGNNVLIQNATILQLDVR